MKKFYTVFKIDTSFNEWDTDYKYVGANSKEDIIQHIREIFPDYVDIVTEDNIDFYSEEYMDDNLKIGDEKRFPWFSDEEFNNICTQEYRIEEVKNLYTDIPYIIVDSFGHIE